MRKWLSGSLRASREPKSQIDLISPALTMETMPPVSMRALQSEAKGNERHHYCFYTERRYSRSYPAPDETQSAKSSGLAALPLSSGFKIVLMPLSEGYCSPAEPIR